jgi:hypothetical protein
MTENKEIIKKNNAELTERNWLLLKGIEQGKTIQEAYQAAGYKGDYNAAYQMYWKLKKKLELVYQSDNTDSLRLQIAAKKIADMPIKEKEIKAETKLKAIETLSRLQGQEKNDKKLISPFIVFKAEDGQISASQGQVIEAKQVEIEENNEMNEGK